MAPTIGDHLEKTTLSLQNLDVDRATSLSDLLGLSPVKNEPRSMNCVRTLQCGEFKYPDVSSPLGKILSAKDAERKNRGLFFDCSPQIRQAKSEDFAVRGGMSVSPYNPSFDEVFQLSSRTPEVSPFRHQPQTYQRLLENGLNTQSPASDVGYGTSFGSQELSGHTLDMDILSNLRSLSLNSGGGGSTSSESNANSSLTNSKTKLPDFGPITDFSQEEEEPKQHQATVGPCLAELDPAVAQASQHSFQPLTNQDFNDFSSNFTNLLSPFRRPLPANPPERSFYGLDTMSLENVAKLHRSSASIYDATCTWRGQLPPRSHSSKTLSPKVFLGGVPWDITEQNLVQAFRPFGPIKIEWPGKEISSVPKGYLYIIFEHEKQVRSLLMSCTQDFGCNGASGSGAWYYKISSKRMRNKEVQVIPWVIADSTFVRCPAAGLDSGKTVFVGALHGMLSAEAIANIFQDLFKGVVYAGIDTDKYKYPIGSGRVVFNNHHSYMKAVSAAFIEIKTPKFTKKIQVDPYLEDALCSHCNLRQGPYYCRDLECFKYYCRSCWDAQHALDAMCHHKPIMRNSRSNISNGNRTTNQNGSTSSANKKSAVANAQECFSMSQSINPKSNSLLTLPEMSPFEL